jgi:hypothetical protein
MASHGRDIRHIAFACGTSFVGRIGRRWIYGESSCVSVRQFTHRYFEPFHDVAQRIALPAPRY